MRWDFKLNCDVPRLRRGRCNRALYSSLFSPIQSIQTKIQSSISTEYFTVGIHIRTQRMSSNDFQEFIDCATEVSSSKPKRYFISSDSQEVVKAFLEKLPNSFANEGEITHSKDKATARFLLDFFGILNCDFLVGTRFSTWSLRMLNLYHRPHKMIGFRNNNCKPSEIRLEAINHTHLN